MKQTLTTFEVAKLLNLSPYTIRLWIIKGLLEGYTTPGGHRRIKKKDLIKFLKENKMPIPIFEDTKKKNAILATDEESEIRKIIKLKKIFYFYPVKSMLELGVKIEKIKPQIIILDFNSKSFSFKELGAFITENNQFSQTVLIGLSKNVDQNLVLEAEKCGFFDVLTKPLSEEELQKTFSKIFGKRKNSYRLKRSR